MMWWNNGGGNMVFGPLFMIPIFAVTVAAIVLLVRWLSESPRGFAMGGQTPAGHTALDILKERFARGEINKDEFEERRRVLREN